MPVDETAVGTPRKSTAGVLEEALGILEEMGDIFKGAHSQLHELHERLGEGRFHLAVLGQFKRGKSTFINALLGEEILPTAVIPLTALPTFIEYGTERRATVLFDEPGRDPVSTTGTAEEIGRFIAAFVTEKENPQNRLGVSQVQLTHPAPLLADGIVLIDTPGVGSTFRHNTEATLNFLPQCDAALFIVSADPPITEVETRFLAEAREKVSRIFFVLNKADYLDGSEREAAVSFLRDVLSEQVGLDVDAPIFCTSAKEGLTARRTGDRAGWKNSGMEEVEKRILLFSAHEKNAVLEQAVRKKASAVLSEAVMQMEISIKSLLLPMEDLGKRLQTLGKKIEEAKKHRLAASDLLEGDKKRMLHALEEDAERLRRQAGEHFARTLQEAAEEDAEVASNDERAQEILAEEIPGYFEHQSGVTAEEVSKRMRKILVPHQKRADDLIESIRRTAADLFEIDYKAPEGEKAFRMVKKPYWVTHKWYSTFSPVSGRVIERLLPRALVRKRMEKRLKKRIDDLVRHNVENIRWSLYQSINETFMHFASSLDENLARTVEAIHGAVRAAMERRRNHGESVSNEVKRLQEIKDKLLTLAGNLEG